MTLWTSIFVLQIHHYSFAREKSNDDTKKRQEKKTHIVDGSGTQWKKEENRTPVNVTTYVSALQMISFSARYKKHEA